MYRKWAGGFGRRKRKRHSPSRSCSAQAGQVAIWFLGVCCDAILFPLSEVHRLPSLPCLCRGPGGWPAGATSTGLSLLAFLLDQTVGKRSLEGSVLIQPLLNLSPLTQVTCPICYLSVPWLLQYFGIFKSQTFNLAPVYFRSFHAVIWNDVMQRFLCFLFPFLKVMFLLPLF